MNDRLEISSGAVYEYIRCKRSHTEDEKQVVKFALDFADALISLEAETQKDMRVGNVATPEEIDIHMQGIEHGKQVGFKQGHAQAIAQVINIVEEIETCFKKERWSGRHTTNEITRRLASLTPEVQP
jgi:hypothetical protein